MHISLHLVRIYLGPSGCFYIWMASSVWRTVEVLWCNLGELLLSWCESRLLCGLGKHHCELLMTLLVSDLRPPSLLCQTICSSCIQSFITEHVFQKSCLEVFALLHWTMLAHKGVIYIFEMHPSGFCLNLLGGFKCTRVMFVGDTCWAWMKILSVLLVFDGSFICFTFLSWNGTTSDKEKSYISFPQLMAIRVSCLEDDIFEIKLAFLSSVQ